MNPVKNPVKNPVINPVKNTSENPVKTQWLSICYRSDVRHRGRCQRFNKTDKISSILCYWVLQPSNIHDHWVLNPVTLQLHCCMVCRRCSGNNNTAVMQQVLVGTTGLGFWARPGSVASEVHHSGFGRGDGGDPAFSVAGR